MALGGVTGQRVLAIFMSSCDITQKREKSVVGTYLRGQKMLLFLHVCYAVEVGKVEKLVPCE